MCGWASQQLQLIYQFNTFKNNIGWLGYAMLGYVTLPVGLLFHKGWSQFYKKKKWPAGHFSLEVNSLCDTGTDDTDENIVITINKPPNN